MRHDISAFCAHTNLDIAPEGVNHQLAKVLGLENITVIDPTEPGWGLMRQGTVAEQSLESFLSQAKQALNAPGLRYASAGKKVHHVAVGGGACGDYEDFAIAAGCDTFVTSDLTYHTFLDAKGKGINLMDAGHFPTEDPVCETLVSYLAAQFPELTVIKSASHREVIQYLVKD